MASLKERIPDEAALKLVITEATPRIVNELKNNTASIEGVRKRYGDYKRFAVLGIVAGIVGPIIAVFVFVVAHSILEFFSLVSFTDPSPFFEHILTALHFIIIIPSAIALVYVTTGLRVKIIDTFNTEVDTVIFESVFKIFAVSGRHFSRQDRLKSDSSNSLTFSNIQTIFLESRLIEQVYQLFTLDSVAQLQYNERKLLFGEFGIGSNKKTIIDGSSVVEHNIFSGYFVVYELQRALEGEIYISADSDTRGYPHQKFWASVVSGDIKETTLEWNDFDNLLYVATNNEIEAREVLSPRFMQNLYDWWNIHKTHIRISFIKDRMYILFPDQGVKFGSTVTEITPAEVEGYAYSIAKPLLHVLHLVEDVRV